MQRKLLLLLALLLLVTVTPVSAQEEVEYKVTYTSDIYQYAATIGPDDSVELCVGPNMPISNPFDDPPEVEAGKVAKHNKTFLTDMIVEIRITEGGNPSSKEMDVFVDFHHTGLQIALLYVNDGDTLSRDIGTEYYYTDVAAEVLHITLLPADLTEVATYEARVTLYWTVQWVIEDKPQTDLLPADNITYILLAGLAVAVLAFVMLRRD